MIAAFFAVTERLAVPLFKKLKPVVKQKHMASQKITFLNKDGLSLSGRIELPVDQKPTHFALFSHCFTCNKNLSAVRSISRALIQKGFGILQFDFTGLGESEGDFADSNFSGNVEDLVSAADYLAKNYKAPELLIGHSLGGAAAYFASAQIPSIKAVATIGAPSNPDHVEHLFEQSLEMIRHFGQAQVQLSGRTFTIKKHFLDDLEEKSLPKVVQNLNKAILILHSPQDSTVGIENAASIYKAAKHPKSFVSLDGADHLLTNRADAEYVGQLIASWSVRYLTQVSEAPIHTHHQVAAVLRQEDTFTTLIKAGDHYLTADEPEKVGGNNFGPTPYDLLAAGLAACTAMTLKMYTQQKKWNLGDIQVEVSHKQEHASDCEHLNEQHKKIDIFERVIHVQNAINDDQKTKLLQIANKCPVHKTLQNEITIRSSVQ